jgi:hypothetical protein
MQITTNEDGTMAKEQSELMNSKSANLLKETFKILSELDTDTLQNADKETGNTILNDVAKAVFNKLTEDDVVRVFHEQLGEAAGSIIQTVFYKVKQLEQGVERGLIEQAMGIDIGEYDNLSLKEMVAKLSEGQKTK